MSTVLLVEDDLANRAVIEDIFQFDDVGAELACVDSGEKAMLVIPKLQPILILMDIRLPGISGLEVTRTLKTESGSKDIPIWAITAYAMSEDKDKALAAGCDEYITKPINSGALREKIRKLISPAWQLPKSRQDLYKAPYR
ncbi:MAG: hypothetical protein AMS16_00520 [Planctomycetes bacterium DG_58]|nr:MAG: hypothetical protein AMS16_00520 [Planctomycetes bacterium DG_58]